MEYELDILEFTLSRKKNNKIKILFMVMALRIKIYALFNHHVCVFSYTRHLSPDIQIFNAHAFENSINPFDH